MRATKEYRLSFTEEAKKNRGGADPGAESGPDECQFLCRQASGTVGQLKQR